MKRPSAAERQDQLKSLLHVTIPITLLMVVIAGAVLVFYPNLNIKHLSVQDSAALREVFFSGQPWVVACTMKGGP